MLQLSHPEYKLEPEPEPVIQNKIVLPRNEMYTTNVVVSTYKSENSKSRWYKAKRAIYSFGKKGLFFYVYYFLTNMFVNAFRSI